MKQVTEYWLVPVDEYGDSIDIIFCDTRQEAEGQRKGLDEDYPDAHHWTLEKVIRKYASDGDLKDETVTELKESWL